MKRIVVMNIKGGVGKTLIANELAFYLDHQNIPYSFFEFDEQGGSTHKENLNPDAAVAIADTPSAHFEEMQSWAKAADLVIIPVRSASFDAHAFISTLQVVKNANPEAAIIIVQNGCNRFRLSKDYEKWLNQKAPDCQIYKLNQSDMLPQAALKKVSVMDHAKHAIVTRQIEELSKAVFETIGII